MTSKMNRKSGLWSFGLIAAVEFTPLVISGSGSTVKSDGAESASWENVAAGGVA
jgi:hypothetical protein